MCLLCLLYDYISDCLYIPIEYEKISQDLDDEIIEIEPDYDLLDNSEWDA